VNFHDYQERLLAELRRRISNGEITERGLARSTGISQPHMHNVLKGIRLFSPAMADRVLRFLQIDLVDLLERDEILAWRKER
jgi:hypothetical protein